MSQSQTSQPSLPTPIKGPVAKLSSWIYPKADPRLPGPKGLPVLGVAPMMIKDSAGMLYRLHKSYGDLVSLPMPGIKGVLVADPQLIQKVLLQSEKSFHKGKIYQRLAITFGSGLVSSQGKLWRQHRRVLDPMFTQRAVMRYLSTIQDSAAELVASWQQAQRAGREVAVSQDMADLTFKILVETLFSKKIAGDSQQLRQDLEVLHDYCNYAMYAFWLSPLWWPTRRNRSYNKASARVDKLIAAAMDRRSQKDWDSNQQDLISLLQGAEDPESGRRLTAKEIRDHVITMYVAGHDTTANTLSFTLDLLASHPEILAKLKAEVTSVRPEGPFHFDDLKAMSYLDQVIHESMRLYPTAYSINRISSKDIDHGGYHFPAGTTFFLPQIVNHRHPEHWKSPEEFRPEHFSKEESASRHKFAFFPFGAGPRNCIGVHLAMMELRVILAHISRSIDFVPTKKQRRAVISRITMSPTPDISLSLR